MLVVPLRSVPNQVVQAQLNGQACNIQIFQYAYSLFMSLSVGVDPIVNSARAMNRNRMVRDAYLGFSGDLAFVDTQGTSNPDYTGLGGRYQLLYFAPADLTALGFTA